MYAKIFLLGWSDRFLLATTHKSSPARETLSLPPHKEGLSLPGGVPGREVGSQKLLLSFSGEGAGKVPPFSVGEKRRVYTLSFLPGGEGKLFPKRVPPHS